MLIMTQGFMSLISDTSFFFFFKIVSMVSNDYINFVLNN
jgi:hypothetical protein